MSVSTKIYPMAFEPDREVTCNLTYVGFPKAWKEVLIQVEKLSKPRWDGTYALPLYALKNSIGAWMEGIIELSPLRLNSNDEKWAIACNQEIDTKLLFEHIVLWLNSYYLGNTKLSPVAKKEIATLLSRMQVKELEELKGREEVRLFDENGIPAENYSYAAYTLMVVQQLMGNKIWIDGREITLYYAGKNRLISDIQQEGKDAFSYGISFSLQTVPPTRKALLLCDCSIHRWIMGAWKESVYLGEKLLAYIWGENYRIYQVPIYQTYKRGEEYYWQEVDKKCYDLYHLASLPPAYDVVKRLDQYFTGIPQITCLYKHGMDGNGFRKNRIGTGVSMPEKHAIYQRVLELISGFAREIDGVERVGRVKHVTKNLGLEKTNLGKELDTKAKNLVARRMHECLELEQLYLEVYCNEDSEGCAKEIIARLEEIFQSNSDMQFCIALKELGSMGAPLESPEPAAALKRIREIERALPRVSGPIGCIILLPGKEAFEKKDPKASIRCGFAKTRRLTQFITPWDVEKEDGAKEKIKSAIADLCRQFGYIWGLDEKTLEDESRLIHTPVIGMHLMTQVKTFYGKARFLPIFVELDYVTGKIYVECDAFEHVRVPYREAAFELTSLSLDKEFGKKCDNAARGVLKQKMFQWKTVYRNNGALVLMEADGNTRALCPGITDGQIQKYEYSSEYCPKELEVGTKESSYRVDMRESQVRIVRIRRNGEVPDYFTEQNEEQEYVASSGIFRYGKNYWAIATRPNNKAYTSSYKETTYSKPHQGFAECDMIELYPLQLQKGDNPDEWVAYTNALRLGAIQYADATIMPIPIHLAKKLEEYIFTVDLIE